MLHALHVVSCMLQVAHAVVASCKLHVNEARLQVDDDGPGIPEEARAEAMARGTQLDEASQGSGLGLAIVRDIAALYRIDFTLEESPAGGLRVRLELPRA